MFHLVALTAEDLAKAVDSGTASRSRGCSPNLTRFNSEKGVLDFITRCSRSSNSWNQRIVFSDWNVLPEEAFEIKDWNQMKNEYSEVLDMDVKVGCGCPAFVFQGPAYIVDQMNSGEPSLPRYKNSPIPEGRAPNVRDPSLDHTLCKHLTSVINRFIK